MAITVNIQFANPVAMVSVGENASPLPLLSIGASVIKVLPDFIWIFYVRRLPRHINLEVIPLLQRVSNPDIL